MKIAIVSIFTNLVMVKAIAISRVGSQNYSNQITVIYEPM